MSKKNNKQNRRKKYETHLKNNEDRERRQEAKMKEVASREPVPEEDWEDVEDKSENERCEDDGAVMNDELGNKRIKKDKTKIKFFQKRVIKQERKRLRKAKKCGVVVYRKAMQTE